MDKYFTLNKFNGNNLREDISDEDLLFISALAEQEVFIPSDSTVNMILNYSKAYSHIKTKKLEIDILLN